MRGYEIERREVWLQVSGRTALKKTDLGKNWEVIGAHGHYIACLKRFFHYASERADLRLVFIGNTTAGSRFLALRFMVRRYGLDYADEQLAALSQADGNSWRNWDLGVYDLKDASNSDADRQAVMIEFARMDQDDVAQKFIDKLHEQQGERDE